MKQSVVVGALAIGLLSGCFARHGRGGAGDGGGEDNGGRGGSGPGPVRAGSDAPPSAPVKLPDDPPRCVVTGSTSEIAAGSVDRLDLLFVIDNGPTMGDEQEQLIAEFPRMMRLLATGGDGVGVARDIHLAVVSTDMGAVGVPGISGCNGFGDDGIMNQNPVPGPGCHASYPPFVSYVAGASDPATSARDLGCVARLGNEGCFVGQPLEAALKALWPSADTEPISFLPDASGFGSMGHGTSENAGFLRYGGDGLGPSVLAIVVVTDGDDCSTNDSRFLTPAGFADPSDPFAQQPMNLRCHLNPGALYPLQRYQFGLPMLRANQADLIVFSVIAGVPPDIVEPGDYAGVNWRDSAQRDLFYEEVLGDPRMIERPDPTKSGDDANLIPTCNYDGNFAYPPLRLVKLAQRFGEGGSIHSICGSRFDLAIDGVVERIRGKLGGACFAQKLDRGDDGTVSCQVDWVLPHGPTAPGVPTSCEAGSYPFLRRPAADRPRTDEAGGMVCEVAQLAVRDAQPSGEGWYYDDFSPDVPTGCPGRIAFTPGARPPAGVQVRMRCLGPVDPPADGGMCSLSSMSGDASSVGQACAPRFARENGLDDSQVYLDLASPTCGGAPCMAYRIRGDLRADCVPRAPAGAEPGVVCPSPQDISDRVYCTCRCDAPSGAPECACPEGFSCVSVFDSGGPALEGSYCIRDGTFAQ